MMQLRPYQQAAVDAVYHHLRTRSDNPAVVLPTAAGKSWVIAQLVRDAVQQWGGRVLVLAHVKELLEQNADKIRRLCSDIPIGIYSAGLGHRETAQPVIVAGIQSVYKRACNLGAFNLVIVDEVHTVPSDGDGMYRTFLADAKIINPQLRIVGLTATPFRLSSGPICTPEGILNHICYEVGVRELIRDGYLCALVTKAGVSKADFAQLHIRGGEFIADEVEDLMDNARLVQAACSEIVAYTQDRNSVLVFASGVRHGRHVAKVLSKMSGQEVGFLDGQTPAGERARLIARFRRESLSSNLFGCTLPPLKYLVNVNVLTTGFDAPNIDCVAILRPTMSPGLWYQMVGRGFRIHPGKQNCLVLDFGGNALRHGPVDQLKTPAAPGRGSGEAPAKECPACHEVVAAGCSTCPACGYAFPPRASPKHDAKAGAVGVLAGQTIDTEHEVLDVRYRVHIKRDAPPDAPQSMRVDYRIGQFVWVSEWICFEHRGYPRRKAEQWWQQRSADPVPSTAEKAVEIAQSGGIAQTEKIVVRTVAGEPYARVVGYTLGLIPEPVPSSETECNLDDIPF
jgi:DNA repair protein RadD